MVTLTVNLDEKTVKNLEAFAQEMGLSPTTLTEKAIQQYLRLEAEKKIAREMVLFAQQHQQLLAEYEGKYVAFHQGQVIDHDQDELALFLRVRKQYPMIGVLIKQVTVESDTVLQVRSPRFEYQP